MHSSDRCIPFICNKYPPTAEDWANKDLDIQCLDFVEGRAKRGDIAAMDYGTDGEEVGYTGHVGIVTSLPKYDEDGNIIYNRPRDDNNDGIPEDYESSTGRTTGTVSELGGNIGSTPFGFRKSEQDRVTYRRYSC